MMPALADMARSFGAAMAQGYHFGRPGPLPDPVGTAASMVSLGAAAVADLASPFDALPTRLINRATERLLLPLSHYVAYRGKDLAEPALVLLLLPRSHLFGPTDRHHLSLLAQQGVITGVLGADMRARPAPDLRGASVGTTLFDGQWAAVVLGTSIAAAMLARPVPGSDTEFHYGVTHDRRRVIAAARCLLRHLVPS